MRYLPVVLGHLFILSTFYTTFGQGVNSDRPINLSDLLVQENKNLDTSIVFKIEKDCVFMIQMTTAESDSIENKNPDAYETISENANNDANRALELFENLKLNNYWSDKRFVEFNSGEKTYLIDTRHKNVATQYCIFFRKMTKPDLILVETLDKEILRRFFKK